MPNRNLLALTVLLAACAGAEQQPAELNPTRPKFEAPVDQKEPDPEFVGVITAKRSTIIPAPFRGRFDKVSVRTGLRVKKDDKIAHLDEQQMKTQIDGFKAEERAASAQSGVGGAQAGAAAKKLASQQHLVEMGSLPPMAVIQTRAEMNAAGAQSGAAALQGEVAKSKRINAERQLAKAEMLAPLDGVVSMIKAKDGEVVEEGATVARISDPTELNIKFALPKEQREKAVPGTPVSIRIDGLDQPLWATIDYTTNEDPAIGFVVVVARIATSAKLPRPNELLLGSVGRVKLEKKTAAL
jgi:RND family efflux transporter MFP subunit